jgi:hypothetical protein
MSKNVEEQKDVGVVGEYKLPVFMLKNVPYAGLFIGSDGTLRIPEEECEEEYKRVAQEKLGASVSFYESYHVDGKLYASFVKIEEAGDIVRGSPGKSYAKELGDLEEKKVPHVFVWLRAQDLYDKELMKKDGSFVRRALGTDVALEFAEGHEEMFRKAIKAMYFV